MAFRSSMADVHCSGLLATAGLAQSVGPRRIDSRPVPKPPGILTAMSLSDCVWHPRRNAAVRCEIALPLRRTGVGSLWSLRSTGESKWSTHRHRRRHGGSVRDGARRTSVESAGWPSLSGWARRSAPYLRLRLPTRPAPAGRPPLIRPPARPPPGPGPGRHSLARRLADPRPARLRARWECPPRPTWLPIRQPCRSAPKLRPHGPRPPGGLDEALPRTPVPRRLPGRRRPQSAERSVHPPCAAPAKAQSHRWLFPSADGSPAR